MHPTLLHVKLWCAVLWLCVLGLGVGGAATAQTHLARIKVLAAMAAQLQLQQSKVPPIAPQFTLPRLRGGSLSLNALRGQWVLVNFWATWCGPCRHEMPGLEEVHRRFGKQGLKVVAVNMGESKAQAQRFIEKGNFSFAVALDTRSAVARQWRAVQLPLTLLINPQGRAVYRGVGSRVWNGKVGLAFFSLMLQQSQPTQ